MKEKEISEFFSKMAEEKGKREIGIMKLTRTYKNPNEKSIITAVVIKPHDTPSTPFIEFNSSQGDVRELLSKVSLNMDSTGENSAVLFYAYSKGKLTVRDAVTKLHQAGAIDDVFMQHILVNESKFLSCDIFVQKVLTKLLKERYPDLLLHHDLYLTLLEDLQGAYESYSDKQTGVISEDSLNNNELMEQIIKDLVDKHNLAECETLLKSIKY